MYENKHGLRALVRSVVAVSVTLLTGKSIQHGSRSDTGVSSLENLPYLLKACYRLLDQELTADKKPLDVCSKLTLRGSTSSLRIGEHVLYLGAARRVPAERFRVAATITLRESEPLSSESSGLTNGAASLSVLERRPESL